MRSQGWTGGRMEEKRRLSEQREKRKRSNREIRESVGQALGVGSEWWRMDSELSDSDDDEQDEEADESIFVRIGEPYL